MAVVRIDVKSQMEKVASYQQLRKPQTFTDYTPEGTRFRLTVFVKSPDGSEIIETFSGGPDRCAERAQEAAYRAALRYIRDFYRHDVGFQLFIDNNVHIAHPFVLEQLVSEYAGRCYELQNKNNFLGADHIAARLEVNLWQQKYRALELANELGLDAAYQSMANENSHLHVENEKLKLSLKKMMSVLTSLKDTIVEVQHLSSSSV